MDTMKVSKDIISLVEEKYQKMKAGNIIEDYLDEDLLGGIKIYINKKPSHHLLFTKIGIDIVYVGIE